jgi:tetratricopeptide (TPR) repeat protein
VLVGNYGCVLAKTGMVNLGISKIRIALGMNAELAYLYEWLGDAYRGQSDEQAALREYRQGITVMLKHMIGVPVSPSQWRDLARVHQKIGDYEQARQAEARAREAYWDELLEGDHRQRIAGPDSGFLMPSQPTNP